MIGKVGFLLENTNAQGDGMYSTYGVSSLCCSAVGKAVKNTVCAQSGYSSLRRNSKRVPPKHVPEWLPLETSRTVTEPNH
jgi:hypothetical protein